MPNLAFERIPLEKDKWNNPQEATNGITTKYTGQNGFASAPWPCEFTIDLDQPEKIDSIRILLWDNLGRESNTIDKRRYQFSLSISSDGINYFPIFSNQNKEGGNGWFIFRFLTTSYARFVKFTGHFNSVNKSIHLVEFEIHDIEIPNPISSNIHSYDINTIIPNDEIINNLIDNAISAKSDIFIGVEEKVNTLNNSIKISNEALQQIELIKHTHDFLKESVKNSNRATKWLISSILGLIAFIFLIFWSIYCDNNSTEIIKEAAKNKDVFLFTKYLLVSYYISKTLLFSMLLFILGWFLKNYRSEKHNYTINKHKAMSLTVATGILTKEEYQNSDGVNIFKQGMEIVFSHQVSGFSKDDSSSPNVVNTLLQKGIPENF